MDTTQLTAITDTLLAEQDKLKAQLKEHQQAVKTIEADLERLQTAIKALGPTATTKKKRGANTKPPVTQEQVTKAITDALADGRQLTKSEIKERLNQAAIKAGKSRAGLALRLDQALKAGNIQHRNGKYQLVNAAG